MTSDWSSCGVRVGMPLLAPGAKLSEVELLKLLGDLQWESIARVLGNPSHAIANEQGERLYASFIDVELCFGERNSPEMLGEGARLCVRNRVRFYARRFVEGLCVVDDREIPDALLEKVASRRDLASLGCSWACFTNAFVAQEGSNQKLKVFRPAGIEGLEVPELDGAPEGIEHHARVQSTGCIDALEEAGSSLLLVPRRPRPILYTVQAESDLNGAGLLYFARYPALLNYGERVFLARQLERPVSSDLVACLSTEHRRIYYFGNANAGDRIQVDLTLALLPPASFASAPALARYRTPFKLIARGDLHRRSDGALIASSLVRKALRVPAHAKAVLAEAERLLRGLS